MDKWTLISLKMLYHSEWANVVASAKTWPVKKSTYFSLRRSKNFEFLYLKTENMTWIWNVTSPIVSSEY
uniref:Uncharacterized protein n=1 Tax=Romanomermis culicivorax TaxID=13658 RepID=A0A915KW85_ROMCU